MGTLRLEKIEKTFAGGVQALQPTDLTVHNGELVVLLGPSGCGKSTLLRMVAGVETPTGGRVSIDEREVTQLPPQQRDVAMVFQSYALYPHMSVRENLGFGLRMRGVPAPDIRRRVDEVAERLELTPLLDRRPANLSGGQRQRVALGRAIARRPAVFLLDEPLSNLDAQLRVSARAELGRLHRELDAPILYVTHDQEEAMTLGDRVAVMAMGRVLQIGRPMEIYARPANEAVAAFVGSPRINLFEGTWASTGGGVQIEGMAGRLRMDWAGAGAAVVGGGSTGRVGGVGAGSVGNVDGGGAGGSGVRAGSAQGEVRFRVGIRPEDLLVCSPGDGDLNVRIDLVEPLGRETLLHVAPLPAQSGDVVLRVLTPPDPSLTAGQAIGLSVRPGAAHLFKIDNGDRID